MPIEVRELIIKTTVTKESGGKGGGMIQPNVKEEIIADCVDQVMDILKDKMER